ncbi:phosphoglycerate dehydrogenase [Dethiosulfatarculus sandiegensis]|uniref:phosphoglycerate dehydrogenase n=1 Tax=Dethiosulfatarculus sandiegensis TaxID=1429043 RepID=UPI0005CA00CE|nr:phosphoglycerate dehydrogenase [Dethiosulfatarculus sandiegensis]
MKKRTIIMASPAFGRQGEEFLETLASNGFNLVDLREYDLSIDDPRLQKALPHAWGFIPGNLPVFGDEFFKLAPELRFISKLGVGLDNIDLKAATKNKVLVCNNPGANTTAVADFTLGLILSLARRIPAADQSLRQGGWQKYLGMELSGKTLGLIGLGPIGRAVAQRAAGFGLKLMGHTLHWPEEFAAQYDIARVQPKTLFREADIISLHCALTPQTSHLIDQEALSLMKPSALLINTARGGLIDSQALFKTLEQNSMGGAALDVYEVEPLKDPSWFELENVILTPHMAWASHEALYRMCRETVDNLLKAAQGIKPKNLVNPEAW